MKTKRKFKQRTGYQKQKKETDRWCSRYIRLRDAILFYKGRGHTMPAGDYVECYTCGKLVETKYSQSGHWKSRGSGGHSGIYFDERAIHAQCVSCNGFTQGAPAEYSAHMLEDYGQAVLDELEIKHKVGRYTLSDLIGLQWYFKSEVERICQEYGIVKWW